MRQQRASLLKEFGDVKDETRPIILALEKAAMLKERFESEKSRYEKMAERIPAGRVVIQEMEVRGRAYKDVFARLADVAL